jgi:hypothetical protein
MVVAQLAVGDSLFWVEDESPEHGNFSPASIGGATTRILLVVDDPELVVARAMMHGATAVDPVRAEHGWYLGRIGDPFGHRWEVGTPIDGWPLPDGSDGSDGSREVLAQPHGIRDDVLTNLVDTIGIDG